jgi:glycosyltransferase involved in cell wall biosynthesis
MANPLVSVILPVYNAETYIAEAIESILTQSYKNLELILINDGSTDRSLDIMQSYADIRIQIISRENRGLVASLNEGIMKAKGKYIARMDADDISLPKRFEEQVAFLEMYPEVGLCGTAVIIFGDKIKGKIWRLPQSDNRIKSELLFSSALAHPTVMMRRELIEKYGLFYDPAFQHAEDFELWTRFAEYTDIANLPEPLLKYRVLENSVSRAADREVEQRYAIMKKIPDRYMQKLKIERNESQRWLHFNLSTNMRMQEVVIDFESLNRYFSLLLTANEKIGYFDSIALKKVLGKKWLINLFYRQDIRALFSKYIFYGIWGIVTK